MDVELVAEQESDTVDEGEIHDAFAERFVPNEFETRVELVEAGRVYLQLPKNAPVSRAARFQWLLDHLNCVISVPSNITLSNQSNDLEIISIVPVGHNDLGVGTQFLVTAATQVIFLSQAYRFVYCLDMSPSHSAVDVDRGQVLFDEIINCFRISLLGLCRQFTIPGCPLEFQPCLYLTVIVNTPFFISPAQQVIIKGVQVSSHNVQDIINSVQTQFHLLEGRIAEVSARAYDEIEQQMLDNEVMVGGLFDLAENECIAKIAMVSPDSNFVNMLRYSMLATSLLPENSLSHILVITDGVVAVPHSNIIDSLLYQLHYEGIAVSFLKVGSSFKAHTSFGYVSYDDLLDFLSHSTLGTVLNYFPVVKPEPTLEMNLYQQLYLLWSFHGDFKSNLCPKKELMDCNSNFISRVPTLLEKRQSEQKVNSSLLLLVSRRMREGYVVSEIKSMNKMLRIKLTLHWKSYIYFHYELMSSWPLPKNVTHIEINISAPYDFLHDITCVMKKDTKSIYRQAVFERFWIRSTQLTASDTILAQQLSAFQSSNAWHTFPDSVRNGMPVFTANSSAPYDMSPNLVLSPSDPGSKFTQMWQPLCHIDANNWRKWFHVHKISLILKHDPQSLSTSSVRFQAIHCRQASTALYNLLSKWSSFVLIDNHTYLKLLFRETSSPPVWFSLIRITSKLPCVTITLGFVSGTPGYIRHRVCEELRTDLASLAYLSTPLRAKDIGCVLLLKPLEKILIRYERMPTDFHMVIFPDGTQNSLQSLPPSPLAGTLFTTLSRYLFHQRWVWSAQHLPHLKLNMQSISRILSTLTKMRIKEGFNFAHSAAGITTMVLELLMDSNSSCVLQYVIFPPHSVWCEDYKSNSGSEEDYDSKTDSEFQIVTEVWIEPQFGRVLPVDPKIGYMDGKHYYELADMIKLMDMRCIHSLLTIEHLSLISQEKYNADHADVPITTNKRSLRRRYNSSSKSCAIPPMNADINTTHWNPTLVQRIQYIPFNFDPINILPLCQQTELLFSMFIEEKHEAAYNASATQHTTANRLLLDNIQKHLHWINDHELTLTQVESQRFRRQICQRHRNKDSHVCPLRELPDELTIPTNPDQDYSFMKKSKWRCFVKGVSMTHVILTFVPATLEDLKEMLTDDASGYHSSGTSGTLSGGTGDNGKVAEVPARVDSQNSNSSEVPINVKHVITLPVYVYDCPVGTLVDSYINTAELKIRDVYEDHRYKHGQYFLQDSIRLKSDESSASPEPKSDESEVVEPRNNARQHCKAIVLTHSKCFALSLFSALHCNAFIDAMDVHAAMDQCEENPFEIDITDYIETVCGHIKTLKARDHIVLQDVHQATPCNELRPIHRLIKDKFLKITNDAFHAIPADKEFYYCRNLYDNHSRKNEDSDDELPLRAEFQLESEDEREEIDLDDKDPSDQIRDLSPLFLHFVCTARYHNQVHNISIRYLPTCLGELLESLEPDSNSPEFGGHVDFTRMQISLDILCLTLPNDVQNVISDYSSKGFRTTSFCSDGFLPSCSSASEASFASSDFKESEPLFFIPEVQKQAVHQLKDEIKWFLQDEIATALLDIEPVNKETLNFVIKHVTDSASRGSCIMEVIDLSFVYGTSQSYDKFVAEFSQISIPSYKLSKVDDLYFLIKAVEEDDDHNDLWEKYKSSLMPLDVDVDGDLEGLEGLDQMDRSEIVSSMNSIHLAGYEEDVSDVEEDYNWLIDLQNKRPNLPNFWLITHVEQDVVKVYFHCRFLELNTTHVGIYYSVQRAVLFEIRNLCKRVNQALLLQSLHDTRTCNHLLEPDENVSDWTENNNRAVLQRLKSMEEINDEPEVVQPNTEALLPFKVGYFTCPVVWELPFVLHPRLKTGPGKSSGLSIGISALKTVLDKFSVTNRANMFVYKDSNANVFYLRLHENVQGIFVKGMPTKSNEFEQTVSRSPSIASLPIGQQRNVLTRSDFSISSTTSSEIRPRVRSFGEKDTKDGYNEEAVTLKVYGITQVGEDIRRDLMQVLQNRLDDAVLELLSVMLARNAMCPLTPEDVHFLQKPFKQPEDIIRLSIQDYSLKFLDSFILYLKQNLLQFLNIPKYTDANNFRFKDYTENENNKILDDNIFVYNQSQNPASGSRGIACIALAIIEESNNGHQTIDINLPELIASKEYINIVASKYVEIDEKPPSVYLEFRIWKQGRVNFDILRDRLCAATSHATWDIITEDSFRKNGLCSSLIPDLEVGHFLIDTHAPEVAMSPKEHKIHLCLDNTLEGADINEIMRRNEGKYELLAGRRRMKRSIPPNSTTQRAILFDSNLAHVPTRVRSVEVDNFEAGDNGQLVPVFGEMIRQWFEFAMEIKAPALRSIVLKLQHPHPLYGTISELQHIIGNYSNDAVKCFAYDVSRNVYVPYKASCALQKAIVIGRNLEHWKMHVLSKDGSEYPELQQSSLKHYQKFLPGHVNGCFITRQKLLWGVVESDSIVLYTYNWSKDMVIKLRAQCEHLEHWLNIRAAVLSASCAQKLGLFHNQAMDRPGFPLNNPYIHCIGDVEAMLKFPKERTKRNPNETIPLEIFRDHYRPIRDDHFDPIVAVTMEMYEIRKQDKKHRDELKKMYSMYQSRSNTSTLAQVQLLLQNSRVVHYCHTPLLYLPRLRLLAAATRDHSIMNPANYTLPDAQGEKWHEVLFGAFISEYRMYLQTLGFMALEVEPKKHATRKHPEVKKEVYYMQKAIMGGILLIAMELCEPFFITKLNAVECNRIATSNSRAAINQFTQSFLDESDKIKVYTHLHSFTYDFHLRSVFNYIAKTDGYQVCEGYHLTHFLDDFMKYYNKAPNYARNLVHADTMVVPNLRTEGKHLYNYLLANVKQYKFSVVNMADELSNATEYVLVQVSNISGVSYKDSQDRQHTDDFDITLIISRISPGDPNECNLHLKYYLILTTRREIYPKTDVERKLGKFRTVSCSRNIEDHCREDDSGSDREHGSLVSLDVKSESEKSQILPNYQSTDEEEDKRSRLRRKPSYVQIKQESVNYLGYYSSHEQLMQQLILNCAENTQKTIRDMVKQGMVHCRTHLLWNKLLIQQEASQLTYAEFIELKGLARLENLCDIHPNLGTLVRQPFVWYQGLAKMLLNKYQDQHRTYISDDGNVQHYVILHPRYVGAFMMLSIDSHMSRGDLYAVYRTASKYDDSDVCVTDRKTLLDGFINCICFYLWSGMI